MNLSGSFVKPIASARNYDPILHQHNPNRIQGIPSALLARPGGFHHERVIDRRILQVSIRGHVGIFNVWHIFVLYCISS
jgi:hypothetical protein